ncbi:MAG: RNA polymerase sigma factor [Planctomycetota bacterium]
MDVDEGQLILAGKAGDQAAWESLYSGHVGRVRAYLLRSGFRAADAEDLVQETFLRAFRSLGGFKPERGSFGRWLGAIARNVARRHWARRREADSFDPELADAMFAGAGNPADDPQVREETAAVGDCVAALPHELGRIVRLRYVDGRTTRGIAAATGLPESTVRLRLGEAVKLLAGCMRQKGFLD